VPAFIQPQSGRSFSTFRIRLRRLVDGLTFHRALHPRGCRIFGHRRGFGYLAQPHHFGCIREARRGIAARIGPRLFVTTGPVLAGVGYLLIRPAAHGFHVVTDLLPGMVVLQIGAVLTSTPLTALNLSSVEPEHGGIASAIQNVVGRLSALIATACVGLIAASTLTDASFARVLQVAAVLFFVAAVIGAVTITNPAVPVEPVSCEVAALCPDRHDAHPQLAHASVDGGRLAADDQGS
jgi:hypothetical protein